MKSNFTLNYKLGIDYYNRRDYLKACQCFELAIGSSLEFDERNKELLEFVNRAYTNLRLERETDYLLKNSYYEDLFNLIQELEMWGGQYDKTEVYELVRTKVLIPDAKGDSYGFVNGQGETMLEHIYPLVPIGFSKGYCLTIDNALEDNWLCQFINKDGTFVSGPYDLAYPTFQSGLVPVRKNKVYGFADPYGNVLTPFCYDDAYPFSDGIAVCGKLGKYGAIDENEKEILPFEYECLQNYSHGLFAAKKNAWGFVDKTGKVIIDFVYDFALSFSNEVAVVCVGKSYFLIDKSNNRLSETSFDWIGNNRLGYSVSEVNGQYYITNKHGKILCKQDVDIPF